MLTTDVVEMDVPLLISKNALKKAHAVINFKDDTIHLYGKKENLIETSSGHYMIPVQNNMEARQKPSINVNLINLEDDLIGMDLKDVTHKGKKYKLLNMPTGSAVEGSDEDMVEVIKGLRKERYISNTKIDVLTSESTRLQVKCDSLTRQLHDAKQDSKHKHVVSVEPAAKHAELLRKLESLNTLTESNRLFREERDNMNTQITQLTTKCANIQEEFERKIKKLNSKKNLHKQVLKDNETNKGKALQLNQKHIKSATELKTVQVNQYKSHSEVYSFMYQMKKKEQKNTKLSAGVHRLGNEVTEKQTEPETLHTKVNGKTELSKAEETIKEKSSEVESLKKVSDGVVQNSGVHKKYAQKQRIARKYKGQVEEQVTKVSDMNAQLNESQQQTAENTGGDDPQSMHELQTETTQLRRSIKQLSEQGSAMSREVYLKPPAKSKSPGKLWKLRCVHGLPDESNCWFLKVRRDDQFAWQYSD
jgi:DNA repair exonuclease SbcCD ATPase subunit